MGTAGMNEGTPTISFSDKETAYLSEKVGLAIVGKFSHSLPSTNQIQRALGNLDLVRPFTWKYLNAKHILIQFKDVTDYARVLNGPNGVPVRSIDIHPMRVFKWSPDFDTFFESPIAAVWCNLIGIPIHLYEESALFAIGKLLGKPIQVDHATINQTRLSFARICVEIDISLPHPEEIILNILGKDTRYKVVWDRIPLFCSSCKHVGHMEDKCLASGRKVRSPKIDHKHVTRSCGGGLTPTKTRQEWRPKETKRASTSSNADPPATDKEGSGNEAHKDNPGARVKKVLHPTQVHQDLIDDDGFQLVAKRHKSKSRDSNIKPQNLERLHLKGNVATVSFGSCTKGNIDTGGGPIVISCGIPNREKEGLIEELDPGEIVQRGGIPIAGLN